MFCAFLLAMAVAVRCMWWLFVETDWLC